MDKTAIKNYAIWARVQLIESCKQRAFEYGITEDGENQPDLNTINGRILSDVEIDQRKRLISQIDKEGYSQVMEEAAYTWFNRFIALRFMEVNGYLPSKVRVLSNENGEFKPEILKQAMSVDIDGLDQSVVLDLLDKQDNEELYKYLLITQCNALNECLPYIFEKISNWTELLFPAHLLSSDGIIGRLVSEIPEEDWTDQVQIMGWLYQYYNTELKDSVFAALKKSVKITKENIPAATQLFTPDWIVRYMVENSLGRLWLEGHPNDTLKSNWKYYLDEAEQEPDVQKQLDELRKEHAALKPKDIKCIDPCMGSGHILCYMFDVLVRIYEDYGYTARDAVKSIVEKNLWGLDIDKRAAQLAYFTVMMKARQHDRRFLTRGIQPHVYAIEESNGITPVSLQNMGAGLSDEDYYEALKQIKRLIKEMHDANEYGSIIHVSPCDWNLLRRFAVVRDSSEKQFALDIYNEEGAAEKLQTIIKIAESLSQKYDVVVTNPPYMGNGGMNGKLSDFTKREYPYSKSDMYAVFIEKCNKMLKKNGYQSMITQHTWMFIGSYESLRKKVYKNNVTNLIHLGIKAFEEIGNDVVQTCAFVLNKTEIKDYESTFVRLVDCKDFKLKEEEFLKGNYKSTSKCNRLSKVPGMPLAYWVSDNFIDSFEKGKSVEQYGAFTGSQNITGDNERFLRYHWEVKQDDINKRWFFYAKGGDYRQYYGNIELVIDWSKNARKFYVDNTTSNLLNEKYWYKEGITYSAVTSRGTGFRYLPEGCLFDKGGPSINVADHLYEILALFNSNVAKYYFWVFNPSINLQVKDVKNFPIILINDSMLENMSRDNTKLCKEDWDSVETSYEFESHPLIYRGSCNEGLLSKKYKEWELDCEKRFKQLKINEEELNRLFINTYGLDGEVKHEVEERDITVRKADLQRDIRSLISYAVGCMMGRYSLDIPGLAFAGGKFDESKYMTFKPDTDAIIPICDDYYFDDDIVGRFIEFVKVVYGEDILEENLQFIADALGGKGTAREIIRKYFIKDFYKDHLKIYQKRPIYWLFSSGKKNGFNALIYMHRYKPDMLARMRTDYVHEQQERYRTQLQLLEEQLEKAAPSERVKINKQINKLKDQSLEIQQYEEKIHHLADQMIEIDLDDGVKVNYAKFQDVLEKLK